MPEVDGIGLADRDFKGATPNGLPFSTMAGQTGGGKQVVGFLGMGILYYFSPSSSRRMAAGEGSSGCPRASKRG